MSAEVSDPYFEAAAAVVDAARELDGATQEYERLNAAVLDAATQKRAAERKLKLAVEALRLAATIHDPEQSPPVS